MKKSAKQPTYLIRKNAEIISPSYPPKPTTGSLAMMQ